jgi:hypothetical protein
MYIKPIGGKRFPWYQVSFNGGAVVISRIVFGLLFLVEVRILFALK